MTKNNKEEKYRVRIDRKKIYHVDGETYIPLKTLLYELPTVEFLIEAYKHDKNNNEICEYCGYEEKYHKAKDRLLYPIHACEEFKPKHDKK